MHGKESGVLGLLFVERCLSLLELSYAVIHIIIVPQVHPALLFPHGFHIAMSTVRVHVATERTMYGIVGQPMACEAQAAQQSGTLRTSSSGAADKQTVRQATNETYK